MKIKKTMKPSVVLEKDREGNREQAFFKSSTVLSAGNNEQAASYLESSADYSRG